jgi:hypothetical protein
MNRDLTEREIWLIYGMSIGAALMFVAGIIDRRFFTTTTIYIKARPIPKKDETEKLN